MSGALHVRLWLSLVLVVGACSRPAPMATGPNVLVLTVDTLRPDYLGVGGYELPSSPALDALVHRGTWFTRATAPVPRTTPALASLLTGLYPHHHGVRQLLDDRRADATTLAQVAQARGYRTVAVVSNHIVKPERGLDAGFDVYDMQGDGRVAAQTTADAISRLRAVRRDQPVLLWVHYIDPHMPYRPPAAHVAAFDPDYEGRYATHFGGEPGSVGKGAYPADLPKRTAVFDNPLSSEVNAHIRRLYAADVRQTDDAIADLLAALRQERGADWVIVFAADHGESLGEHGYFWDHGDYVYEAGTRVPLAFVDEREPRTTLRRVDTPTSLVDVAPTLADLLGWAWPRSTDGRSLRPALLGEALEPRPVFAECGRNFLEGAVPRRVSRDVAGRFRSVTLGSDKLIYTPGHAEPWELYDLAVDPSETTNLWSERGHTAEARALVTALRAWMAEDDQAAPVPEPSAEDLEALRALGYVE